MVHNRGGIIVPDSALSAFLLICGHEMRLMNSLRRYMGQFRNIPADVGAVRVELLALKRRVENPIPPHGIRTGGGTPLPITVVCRHVSIDEMLHEILFAALPIDPKIFDEKGCHDHSDTVVHPSRLSQLPHAGVDDRIACLPVTPGLKQAVSDRTRLTRRWYGHLAEWPLRNVWKRSQYLLKELTPDQFVNPGQDINPGHWPAFSQCIQRRMNGHARRQCSETEVW
jgi:hypothetical protein